ncbi:MAG: hypothetical protein JWN76_3648 [Chitinophagaceae bacterium]|nr:hypothetical protein [Chitinophagaceae bacterium]
MKKIIFLAIIAFSFILSNGQIRMPQPSPTQVLIQNFGMGKIELTYSRPSVKGRAVFKDNSELAPVGQVWRTGANSATKLRFTDPVTIGGQALDSGTYALYTIPGKNEWTIIINKGSKNWGTEYHQEDDVFRFPVKTDKMDDFMENFTMQFNNIKPESCELQLMWAKTLVKIPVIENIKDPIRTQIESAFKSGKTPYFEAANFYYEYDKDYAKALDNVNKALAGPGNANAYWMYLLKAKIQKATGDKAGAKATAEQTVKIATEQKNDDYARAAKELIRSI